MAGQKFQYDESGATFFYFLLSFLALILIPATFYYWPRKKKEDPEEVQRQCKCSDCIGKREFMKATQSWEGPKNFLKMFSIILGWVLLIAIAYKVSQFDYEMVNFDPYEILNVPLGASQADIKKSYRKMSLILHPDKETGNEKEFMKLSKAYQALTDEESRRNWEKYGNPDGPGAMSFGIALPSWIVEKENSIWVLGLYALVFMVALPIVVGTWWYRSIKFSGEKILLDTTQMYFYFFHKTPNMMLKRIIMILAASLEFDKKYNSEIVIRPSDDEEVPQLTRKLPNLGEKNQERPLCYPYSIKARALLHAHFGRIPLNPKTLELDRQYVVSKCPYLIQEQVNCVNQLILMAYARRTQKLPSIETIENCMKLCPMIIQGIWDYKSCFLQLPYITEDNLKFFSVKKRPVKSLQQFAQLKNEERRSMLRNLSDEQYEEVEKVLGALPLIDFQVRHEVVDDENPTEVTAGAIVTVTVTLIRKEMSSLFQASDEPLKATGKQEASNHALNNGHVAQDSTKEADDLENLAKRPAWLKQKKSGAKKNVKKASKQKSIVGKVKNKPEDVLTKTEDEDQQQVKTKSKEEDSNGSDNNNSDDERDNRSSEDELKNTNIDDDDEEWERFQQKNHRTDKVLEGRSKKSHSVMHCPYFPHDKQEYWWTYICDRKSKTLLTAPCHITSLVDREECTLRFTAPNWKGVYTLTVCLRSDSYVGFDQQKDLKLDVKSAPDVPTEHPQWDFEDSEEEDEAEDDGRDSEYATDDELPDED